VATPRTVSTKKSGAGRGNQPLLNARNTAGVFIARRVAFVRVRHERPRDVERETKPCDAYNMPF